MTNRRLQDIPGGAQQELRDDKVGWGGGWQVELIDANLSHWEYTQAEQHKLLTFSNV